MFLTVRIEYQFCMQNSKKQHHLAYFQKFLRFQMCYHFINTIPWNTKNNMVVKLKMAAKNKMVAKYWIAL